MHEFWKSVVKWATGWFRGGPHFVIGPAENPQLHRWYVIPRNAYFNIYLHKFLRNDDDRALHDHPWRSIALILTNGYIEQTAAGRKYYRAGSIIRRHAEYAHRIELVKGRPVWTLFITGPVRRRWGFWCPQGFVHWKEFVSITPTGNQLGKGCDQRDAS